MSAFLRPGARTLRLTVPARRRHSSSGMAICGSLLAACTAAPNTLNVGAAVSNSDLHRFSVSDRRAPPRHCAIRCIDRRCSGSAEMIPS
jgi:hypothetical protein